MKTFKEVAPSQGRGLKPKNSQAYSPIGLVAPSQGRGLKRQALRWLSQARWSPLHRGVD